MDLWTMFNNILIILTLSNMASEVLFTIWQGGQNVVKTAKNSRRKNAKRVKITHLLSDT
jgi:hypothetical protein